LGPPGGKGTISLIGLFGKSCACANAGLSRHNPATNNFTAFTAVLHLHFALAEVLKRRRRRE
jgi:hypothetical protein